MTTTETEQSAFVAKAKTDTPPFDPAGKDLHVVFGWDFNVSDHVKRLTANGWVAVPGSFHAVSLHGSGYGSTYGADGQAMARPYIFVQFWRAMKETP